MEKNAFELLQDELDQKFEERNSSIKKNVEGRKDLWSFIGELIELYLPKFVSTLLGGRTIDTKK